MKMKQEQQNKDKKGIINLKDRSFATAHKVEVKALFRQ